MVALDDNCRLSQSSETRRAPRARLRIRRPERAWHLLLALAAAAGSATANAWGADGHRLIAEAAEARLSGEARAELHRLLALEAEQSLSAIATWADEARNRATAPWHYVLMEEDCSGPRACRQGACVVAAIERQADAVGSSASDADRLRALKFLVHLVGDIHQPLHAGAGNDRGGNLFQLRTWGKGSNLHALWDSELIRRRPGGLAQLRGDIQSLLPEIPAASLDPVAWARESCRVATAAGFYPDSRVVGDSYAAEQDRALVEQLARAARRLGELLDAVLRRTRARSSAPAQQ